MDVFSPKYNGEGGRRVDDLKDLVGMAKKYLYVFVIVGDNDAKSRPVTYIYKKFVEFRNAIWPTQVKFAGNMRRKDLPPQLVSSNNMFLRNKLGFQLKGTRVIRREDFCDYSRFHFDKFGEGVRHMAVMILSVFREFDQA